MNWVRKIGKRKMLLLTSNDQQNSPPFMRYGPLFMVLNKETGITEPVHTFNYFTACGLIYSMSETALTVRFTL